MAGSLASATISSSSISPVVRLCHQGLPAVELLGQVLALVRRVVPFDASFWSTTDPATLLPTGGLVHNLPLAACQPYFDNELLVPDVNKFVELASAARPVGVLSQATAGDLRRSARYRTFEDLFGLGDELRVAFVADGWCWGGCRAAAPAGGLRGPRGRLRRRPGRPPRPGPADRAAGHSGTGRARGTGHRADGRPRPGRGGHARGGAVDGRADRAHRPDRLLCAGGWEPTRSPRRCSCRPIPCAATSRRCSPRSAWAAAASWSRGCSPTTTTTG